MALGFLIRKDLLLFEDLVTLVTRNLVDNEKCIFIEKCNEAVDSNIITTYLDFKENDNTLKFAKHVSTETSVIFS